MSCRYRGRKFPLTEVVNIGRTAAKARSAQGASQFAAGNAAARLHQLSRVRMAVKLFAVRSCPARHHEPITVKG